ncbi:hypothetical protein GCM10010428_08680 [Actinosynnema pretiosum subsp. pretiosum]
MVRQTPRDAPQCSLREVVQRSVAIGRYPARGLARPPPSGTDPRSGDAPEPHNTKGTHKSAVHGTPPPATRPPPPTAGNPTW